MHLRRIHPKTCETCGGEFMAVYLKNRYCSKLCSQDGIRRAGSDQITFELLVEANNFLHLDEKLNYVMNKTGLGHSSVNYKMADMGFKWARQYTSRAATRHVKARLKVSGCQLCGEDRLIEMAHILADADGGTATDDNLVPLCPTHHKLFDVGKLDQQESEDLEYHFQQKFNLRWKSV